MYPVTVPHGNKIAMPLLCALFITSFTRAQCVASGPNSPGASTSTSFPGSDFSFSNPSNVLANDNSRSSASSVLSLFSGQTEHLQATDFGFSIPTAATICGIEVHVAKSATDVVLNLTSVTDYNVQIIKNGVLTGTNQADQSTSWPGSDTYTSYGNTNDLWGTSWTPNDINSSNFGISFSAAINGLLGIFPSARIDHMSVTVYYMDPTVLPAHAIQFRVANGSNQSALLSWKSNVNDDNVTAIIERSANGKTWEALPGTAIKNNITSLLTFRDAHPLPGKSLYRLKMTTASGDIRYTTVQPFQQRGYTSVQCYPNPFNSFIQVAGITAGEELTLTDLYGKRLYRSLPAVNNTLRIDVSHLQPGMYVIGGGNRKIKMLKK
ncbi:T9SS type A sorting domain-containing protein [Longitalea luteola]|uniref:T9SS type A sorting domain-containing protein n=1 Tax=Longitalea luteola TaxID=2812563 RepID=UPI001A95688E|nr:T9SS type A sorting domain-containing protein [Longitalea luteola]